MNATDEQIKDLLARFKKITVIGLSPKPSRPSHGVTDYMIRQGYEIIGVRPAQTSILGRPVYPTISDVPGPLEIVNVFRNNKELPSLFDTLMPLRPKVIWLQEGLTYPTGEELARKAGIIVVSDRCILKEHARLLRAA